ncbi:hypothetical protein CCACVL1_27471 [Corchorus capsularis]|uniref:Uncharacterized protein n=1 Tax=Corchorus capsularis TaxID=210143 RepID=A0A1R3GA25_COCAP|nr:hypothetical protein CCACVL1_27471 [Corchorus capsularis]
MELSTTESFSHMTSLAPFPFGMLNRDATDDKATVESAVAALNTKNTILEKYCGSGAVFALKPSRSASSDLGDLKSGLLVQFSSSSSSASS